MIGDVVGGNSICKTIKRDEDIIVVRSADYYFTCPTNYFAQKFAEHGMNVYYYHFTQVIRSN